MGLSKYREKRDFSKTPEPTPKKSGKHRVLTFVVQRHDATRLHYDFRLELEGVLKSWAVPKGPSMVSGEKRLVVMVEDHPLEYGEFHGEIPKGNYGAGRVDIWDRGTYTPYKPPENVDQEMHLLNQLEKGDIKIHLKGKYLKGAFALVRIKGDDEKNWLLIKKNDGYNLPEFDIEAIRPLKLSKKTKRTSQHQDEASTNIQLLWTELNKPMLATLVSKVPNKPDWIYEVKYDGYRALTLIDNNNVTIVSRNGNNFNHQFKALVEDLKRIDDQVVLDGEIVIENEKGVSDFQKLQNYINNAGKGTLLYYVFDILLLNEHKTINLPLTSRKELLHSFFEKYQLKKVINSVYQVGEGESFYNKLSESGYEGIITKAPDSKYHPGKRSKSWLKVKSTQTIEAIICGFTEPQNSRKHLGALLLGTYNHGQLNYIGSCGTGFNDKILKELFYKLSPLVINDNPFNKSLNNLKGNAVWVKPELICCVKFLSWTNDKILRNPVFLGLKDHDESKGIISYRTPATMNDESTENQQVLEFGRKKLKVTNLNKIYWPNEGITKGNLISYYDDISDYILPYLKNRPQSLNRFPNGIKGPSFYQKDMDVSQVPNWAKTVKMYSKSNDNEIDYLLCNDKATLLYMANLGCIEINPWHSIYSRPDNPDYMMLDLDPGEIAFTEVVKTALVIKELCDSLDIDSYCKTSGATGLHIYIPLGAKYDYEQVKSFAEILASITHERLPSTTSVERMTSKRKDKVYVDFLQNRKGQTIAAPYSVRPRPGATVSTPLKWEEVNQDLDPSMFNINNIEERLDKVGDLWQGVLSKPINIMKALKKIEKFNY